MRRNDDAPRPEPAFPYKTRLKHKTISENTNATKKIIRADAKKQAVDGHAWCRRCADDGRQLWNGCLDEDVLLVLLAVRCGCCEGLMLCCVTDCVRMVDAKAVVGRRSALCARCCLCWETTPPIATHSRRSCKLNPVNFEDVFLHSTISINI